MGVSTPCTPSSRQCTLPDESNRCVSVWIGGAVSLAAPKQVPGFEVAAAALAFSLAAGVINEIGAERD